MSLPVFSQAWAEAWGDELRSSRAYREAAATWEGSIVLEMAGADRSPGSDTAVFVDLFHGECRSARAATGEDRELADFLIRAEVATWKRVLAGDLEPVFGILSGQLSLIRGSLAKLVPQVAAARELVAAAARIDTEFPAG